MKDPSFRKTRVRISAGDEANIRGGGPPCDLRRNSRQHRGIAGLFCTVQGRRIPVFTLRMKPPLTSLAVTSAILLLGGLALLHSQSSPLPPDASKEIAAL